MNCLFLCFNFLQKGETEPGMVPSQRAQEKKKCKISFRSQIISFHYIVTTVSDKTQNEYLINLG